MITRNELSALLADTYNYGDYEDYCENGLQVEGKKDIRRIEFGVSFHLPFLEEAIRRKADAVIVHHGIFQRGDFVLKGTMKRKIKLLLEHDISLYGIHLPMDGHLELGHSARLLSALGAADVEASELLFSGRNALGQKLDQMLDTFHEYLHPADFVMKDHALEEGVFSYALKHGFAVVKNGPDVPKKVAVVSGGGSGYFEKALAMGADTFVTGDIKEHIPAYCYENRTNFINIGHYFSEKPGVLALKDLLEKTINVETGFIEVPNPV